MSSTPVVPLGDIAQVVGGGTPKRDNAAFYGGSIPWVTPKDMKSAIVRSAQVYITEEALHNSPTKLIPPDAVLVVVRSGVLKHTLPVALTTVPVAINQDLKALVCSEDVHPAFLARLLTARSPEILSWVKGTTAHNFSIDLLKNLRIPLPPLAEQRRIADILDRVDAMRAKRRFVRDRMVVLEQALFIEMFGEPTTNPMEWDTGTLADLFSSVTYGTSRKAAASGELPILRMGNVTRSGEIDLGDMKYIDLPPADLARHTVRKGDILFNRTNSADLVGKTAVVRFDTRMAYAGYLIRLRCNDRANPSFVGAFLNLPSTKTRLRGMCKRIIGMANINARELQSIKVPIPPVSLQNQFESRASAVRAYSGRLAAQESKLDELFVSLQSEAFRGDR